MEPELTPIRPSDAGFTLIELLVVISVLSILSVGATLAASRQGASAATADRAWFEEQYTALRDLATQGRNSKGLSVTPKGLSFARKTAEGWQIGDPIRRWRGKVSVAGLRPQPGLNAPDIILLASGQSSAFDIRFTGRRGPSQNCHSDGWTGLTCDTN
jgi:prepilin-type N-terminal cleavage/methylation domain-containing protein